MSKHGYEILEVYCFHAFLINEICNWFIFGVSLHQRIDYDKTKYIIHETK